MAGRSLTWDCPSPPWNQQGYYSTTCSACWDTTTTTLCRARSAMCAVAGTFWDATTRAANQNPTMEAYVPEQDAVASSGARMLKSSLPVVRTT